MLDLVFVQPRCPFSQPNPFLPLHFFLRALCTRMMYTAVLLYTDETQENYG